ncbi:MAG TPA: GNAT family N-acetyltransferase [Ktedonobacteraceae bacterium]|nr:GNAT family N-acetyltransferase [Ktedonobacteraceae bacterium]
MSTVETRAIRSPETYDLRRRILRPHRPLRACAYPYDTAPGALHIGCFLNEQLVSISSILPDARKDASQPTSWRMRGMAVLEDVRGTGLGSKILQTLILA